MTKGVKQKIPFSTFSGTLKSVRVEQLSEIERRTIEFTMPEFFTRPIPTIADLDSIESLGIGPIGLKTNGIEWGGVESPFGYRRYAGGALLPRGCYYSICADNTGNDAHTLAREMMAYTQLATTGGFELIDCDDPREVATADQIASLLGVDELPRGMLVATFEPQTGAALTFLKSKHDKSGTQDASAVVIRSSVNNVQISKVIDLRYPNTLKWLYESLRDGIPRVTYVYGQNVDERLLFEFDQSVATTPEPKSGKHSGTARVYLANQDLNMKVPYQISGHFGLLPFLMFAGKGGSPVTDAIGSWLQQEVGANALIFPSSRSNAGVHIDDGKLIESHGWCLVDFRTNKSLDDDVRLIVEPMSWAGFAATQLRIDPVTSKKYGSWRIFGVEEAHEAWRAAEKRKFNGKSK